MRSASCATTVGGNYLARILHWLADLGRSWRSHPPRQLRLRETLTLGERRFIAVVEFEREKFLIAGTGSSVAMLMALPSAGAKGNPDSEAGQEEVPTWAFSREGPARQLIRR
jgi:flagellar biogenesis protein FliO